MRTRILLALGFIAAGTGAAAFADEFTFAKAAPVADSTLDEVRGGLDTSPDLRASMTIERTVYLNGELVANLSATVADIGNITAAEASALANAAGTLLIQNGPNNAFNVSDLAPASTVIQNTLNDQHLMTLTTISVDVNSLGAFREMNFQDGLRDALAMPGVR